MRQGHERYEEKEMERCAREGETMDECGKRYARRHETTRETKKETDRDHVKTRDPGPRRRQMYVGHEVGRER